MHQGLLGTLGGIAKLLASPTDEQKQENMHQAYSTIILAHGDDVLWEVTDKETKDVLH